LLPEGEDMAEGKEEFLSKLIDSVPVLLIILGAALLALGLAGGVTYSQWFPIPEMGARIGAGVAGIVVFALGVSHAKTHVFLPQAKIPQAEKYGIKIDYPTEGIVDIVAVGGSLSKPLPEGFTLKVFRIYPTSPESYIPIADARMLEGGKWRAERCDIGGRRGDERSIGVYLVGPNGAALIDYYTLARRLRRSTDEVLKAIGKEGSYLPPIEKRTLDMIECGRVPLERKSTKRGPSRITAPPRARLRPRLMGSVSPRSPA